MLQRKNIAAELLLKDASQGLASAVFATTDQVDHDGDIYGPAALRPGVAVVSAWNHDASLTGGALPVGKATVRTAGTEFIADVEYFMDLPRGREAFEVIRKLGQVEWSWLLDIHSAEPATVDGRPVRKILDVTAREVSPVVQAAGVGTRTLELRSASDDAAREFLRFQQHRYLRGVRSGEWS
ncbi:hypothetical protein E1218_13080 [Kribbella turkmenica]|uniref:HK97 family phage prohead protease n=1 Tax=Kribbella turkmenica TaxID=2530375 RepID=A0A4R4X804_9ACTN|nr:hypothetical protein [Kribbella turkmenica]TDD26542.1 hypothetical protein E1218_13080 [Kribbella turkmenica]